MPYHICSIQPKKSTDRGSISSPYELAPHDAQDTRDLMRRPTTDKRSVSLSIPKPFYSQKS